MEMPWLDHYAVRNWETVRLELRSPEYQDDLKVRPSNLVICGSDSKMAEKLFEKGQMDVFYFDVEQVLGMDLDRIYGVDHFGILAEPWMGHPAGSLVLSVFEGADENPPKITVGIAAQK